MMADNSNSKESEDKNKRENRLKKNGPKNGGMDIKGVLDFVREHIRYFSAGALLLVLVLVLVKCANPVGQAEDQPAADTEMTASIDDPYELNAHEDVNDLINRYFAAYAAGDIDTLVTLASPVSEKEKAYISLYSQYVEEYRNINCYTKQGLDSRSYMVAVQIDIKFAGVETTAPGLDFFYVRTNDDGTLYIDNLYSNYNLANQENAFDTSVYSLLLKLINGDEHLAMQGEVQARYEEALASDTALSEMVMNTIPNAINEWIVQMANASTEAAEGTEQPTENAGQPAENTEQPADAVDTPADADANAGAEEPPQNPQEMVYAADKVNVRGAASTDAERIGSLEKGTQIARMGIEGEWSIVDYGGQTGYVKSEYLSTEPVSAAPAPAEDTTSAPAAAIAEGTVVTLNGAVNIRSSMSETADKVGTAYAGEKVTVQMSYAEGWTKVSWNGKTGYVKTSLLE